MSVLFIVLPVALLLSGLAVLAFIWAARRGQFDDLTTPAYRLLVDDDKPTAAQRGQPPAERDRPITR